jgi:orotate phosphoribosyltransferase-like protein
VAKSKSIETDAAKLYNSGLAIDDVAEELGVCYRTARKALRNSGVALRDPSARLRGRTSPKRKKAGNE